MKTGIYTGVIDHLRGKTAILRECDAEGCVEAQFDDKDLTRDGMDINIDDYPTPPENALGYGWHIFPAAHFEVMQ